MILIYKFFYSFINLIHNTKYLREEVSLINMPYFHHVARPQVVFEDPFHLKNLYKLIYQWLHENEYLDKNSEKRMEILYSEQVRPNGTKEYHIWWRVTKQPDNKYFKYHIYIDFLGLNIKDTEVVKDEKKHKMQVGEITVTPTAELELEANDPKEKWANHWLLSTFRHRFRNRWYISKIEQHEDDLFEEVYRLQRTIKDYLELRQYAPTPDLFFKERGYT